MSQTIYPWTIRKNEVPSLSREQAQANMDKLTHKQRVTVCAVRDWWLTYKQGPRVQDLVRETGICATDIYKHLYSLVDKGVIVRKKYSRDGIRLPDGIVVKEPVKPVRILLEGKLTGDQRLCEASPKDGMCLAGVIHKLTTGTCDRVAYKVVGREREAMGIHHGDYLIVDKSKNIVDCDLVLERKGERVYIRQARCVGMVIELSSKMVPRNRSNGRTCVAQEKDGIVGVIRGSVREY